MSTLWGKIVPLALVALASFAIPAESRAAWLGSGEGIIVDVQALSGQKTGHLTFTLTPSPTISDVWEWTLPADPQSRIIMDGDQVLATLQDLRLTVHADPTVSLGFAVSAGDTDTVFKITSATVNFAAINDPLAWASAAITVTDDDGNGALLTGMQPGGKAYQARYNDPRVVYANLVDPVTALAENSAVGSERRPVAGMEALATPVDRIESEFYFTLSAHDLASGSSQFEVVPEPATLGLLALASVAVWRRRR